MSDAPSVPELSRFPTGVAGLDAILRGGLFRSGIYVVVGAPGVGKTIFANQVAFHHAAHGGRVAYVTLLSETHSRMLAQMRGMGFYEAGAIGDQIKYLNGFAAIEAEGLSGLLQLLRGSVREQGAELLVLDGMLSAETITRSSVDYKKFINELQTWVGVVGCTVIFLTSAGAGAEAMTQPEHSMVDGILEMRTSRLGLRAVRYLAVTKFRGSGFSEGAHSYLIGTDGIDVYPRIEAHYDPPPPGTYEARRLSTGVARLDEMMGGGMPAQSTTVIVGPSGVGKTILGLQFLAEGTPSEPALHFGFYENEPALINKALHVGLDLPKLIERGSLSLDCRSSAELLIDRVADDLLRRVRTLGVKRLFIDGLVALNEGWFRERISGFFSVLHDQLSSMGVTTLVTEEPRHLFEEDYPAPAAGMSALFDNIIFLQHRLVDGEQRRFVGVRKTRDSAHDRRMFEFDIGDAGVEIKNPLSMETRALTRTAGALGGPPKTQE